MYSQHITFQFRNESETILTLFNDPSQF